MRKLLWVVLLLLAGCENEVPVLLYHWVGAPGELPWNARPDSFVAQMDELKARGYTTITLDELYAHKAGEADLPDRAVVLTFDDGDRTFYDVVYPVLRERGFKAELFLVEGFVRETDADRFKWTRGDVELPMLIWPEVEEMSRSGTVVVESHSETHPKLTEVPLARAREEISASRERLRARLGVPVRYFGYPAHGVNAELMEAVEQAGYAGAVAGANRVGARYGLFRMTVFRHQGVDDFRAMLGRNWADSYIDDTAEPP